MTSYGKGRKYQRVKFNFGKCFHCVWPKPNPKQSEAGEVIPLACVRVSSIDLWTEAGELRNHICHDLSNCFGRGRRRFMGPGPKELWNFTTTHSPQEKLQ